MSPLRIKLEKTSAFLIGAELVSTRGTLTGARAGRTLAYARELAASPRVDWVSITDNAGGHPMLAPAPLGRLVRAAGGDVVIHLSCKDFNRNGLESEAWQLASEGLDNLLVLTGDAAGTGVGGGAKPVFDLDSVSLLWLLGRMNSGLEVTRPGAREAVHLAATRFFSGCVVSNFKRHENEVMPQLLKLEKKLAAATAKYPGEEIPLPDYWGGYCVAPTEIEFWQGRPNRLHDRFMYRRHADASWLIERLSP